MIEVLNKEFGESASKFYGTNIIQKNTNSRAVTTNDGYYNLKIEVECTENWGIWWDYFTTTATLKCYVPNTSIEGRYKPDTGRFKYKDIVNDYSTYVDWVYLAEEVEKYYGKKHTKEEQVEQLDKEIELAKRGSFEYKGKAINGWFPKIGKATYYVEFSAPNKWSQKSISKSGTLIDRD